MATFTKAQLKLAQQRMAEYPFLHRGAVKRWCYTMRHDDDLLQIALMGVWKAALHCKENRPFPPYAMVCAHNELINYLRQEVRQNEATTAALRQARRQDYLAPTDDYLALRTAVRHRWPRGGDKATILLALADGVPLQQVAKGLGCSSYRAKELARRGAHELGLA